MSHPARAIRLLVLDVDGVLTDGSIWVGQDGYELKRFHVRDGLGIKMWIKLGFHVAVISGRSSAAVQHRMDELGVAMVYQGVHDKVLCLSEILDRTGLSLEQTAYIGDDWPDHAAMRRVGMAVAVADAEEPVRKAASFVTTRRGGEGAVREAIDFLLKHKGTTEQVRHDAGADGADLSASRAGDGDALPM
ncbi:MAG: HAD hydrolase family protein [Phycisphaeraceae bacterium]|nr:MAG: HAD hydrolase family protein [Phycisphaeraceae bacterium]